jgi:hypothetical protein
MRVPAGTVIHEGSPVVVQEQLAAVSTVSVPVRPAEVAETVPGVTVKVHGAAPGCVTVKVRPATVAVPMRWVVDVFGATVTVALPFPRPLAPAVMVSQLAPLVAAHAQLLPVVTATGVASPTATEVRAVGEIA